MVVGFTGYPKVRVKFSKGLEPPRGQKSMDFEARQTEFKFKTHSFLALYLNNGDRAT